MSQDKKPPVYIVLGAGDLTTGKWCPVCKLPSSVEVSAHLVDGDGVGKLGFFTFCTDHELS